MRTGAHIQVVIWPGNHQFFEEDGAEFGIIVLSRMNDRVAPMLAGTAISAKQAKFKITARTVPAEAEKL